MMSLKRILLFLLRVLLYLFSSPILIILALPLSYSTLIDLSTNTILEAIAYLGSRLASWIPILGNEHSIRVIEFMFGRETRKRIQGEMLHDDASGRRRMRMRMQAGVANHGLGTVGLDQVLVHEEGRLSGHEMQQRVLRDLVLGLDLEAWEMARLCRLYLGRMMALRIESRDLNLPEPEL